MLDFCNLLIRYSCFFFFSPLLSLFEFEWFKEDNHYKDGLSNLSWFTFLFLFSLV